MNINWLTLLLLLSLGLTVVGCGEAPMTAEEKAYQAKLIGTWVHEERPDFYFSFEEEKAVFGGAKLDYRIKGETIHFIAPNGQSFTGSMVLTPPDNPTHGVFTLHLPGEGNPPVRMTRKPLGSVEAPPLSPYLQKEDPNAVAKPFIR